MAHEELTLEKKKALYNVALGIAGVQFDNPEVVELLILVYERMMELEGKIGVDELIEMRDEFLKKHPINEPSGPKLNKE